MSSTSLNEIYKTKSSKICELRNGHGSAPPVWDYINLKCNGEKFRMFNESDDLRKFWDLWKDKRLTEDERMVLLSTYDYAYIEIDRLDVFYKSCLKMHTNILEMGWDWSHWEDISEGSIKLFKKT